MQWAAYYRAHPFDDRHRYHRPAALIAGVASHAKDLNQMIADNLDWLTPDPALAEFSSADMRTLCAFGIRPGA